MLARPDYVTYSEDGSIHNIFCKMCGDPIAGYVTVPLDTKTRGIRWRRFPNYTEIKIEFGDNSFHVTNGCKKCMSLGLSRETMNELYAADMAEQGVTPLDTQSIRVVALDTTGVGIL